MENKSIVTPYMTEYHEPAHKHMKKLIALVDRMAKYKRENEVKITVDAFYRLTEDLTLITDIIEKCSHNNKYDIIFLQDFNRMWKQYK